jgi:hypothetical protein
MVDRDDDMVGLLRLTALGGDDRDPDQDPNPYGAQCFQTIVTRLWKKTLSSAPRQVYDRLTTYAHFKQKGYRRQHFAVGAFSGLRNAQFEHKPDRD